MNELKRSIEDSAAMIAIGNCVLKEGKDRLNSDLMTLVRNAVKEQGIVNGKFEICTSTIGLLEEVMDYYSEEDGDLYDFLTAFALENIQAMKEALEEAQVNGKEKSTTIEEAAAQLLFTLQQKIYRLAHFDGKMRNSSKLIAEQMKYLDEHQVLKAIVMTERDYILNLNMLKRSEENRGK